MKDSAGNYIIQLLPAIPSAWPAGSVRGLKARGGYVVDMDWKDGNIVSAVIKASRSGKVNIRYKDKTKIFDLKTGGVHKMTSL